MCGVFFIVKNYQPPLSNIPGKSSQNFTQHYVVEKYNQTKLNITCCNDRFLYFDQKVLPLSVPLDEPEILDHIFIYDDPF